MHHQLRKSSRRVSRKVRTESDSDIGSSKNNGPTVRRESADKTPKGIRISRTKVGLGVFARRFFPAEAIIGEIKGELIEDQNYGSNYCMCLGDGRVLEPAEPFRLVNHSCQPNCEFVWFDLAATPQQEPTNRRMFLIALDDIRPNEQLTIDYAWPASGAIPCKCGADLCRGWIVNKSESHLFSDQPNAN